MTEVQSRFSALHLRPDIRNEAGHIEFGIDPLNLFAEDQPVLRQIEKRALCSHILETCDFWLCENIIISDAWVSTMDLRI